MPRVSCPSRRISVFMAWPVLPKWTLILAARTASPTEGARSLMSRITCRLAPTTCAFLIARITPSMQQVLVCAIVSDVALILHRHFANASPGITRGGVVVLVWLLHLLIQLSSPFFEFLRLLLHALHYHLLVAVETVVASVVAHLLTDFHRAELGPAHRAEVGHLG